MSYTLSSDVEQRIAAFLAEGAFASPDDVMRSALDALGHREADFAAVREGFEDFQAGRWTSLEEFDAEMRRKHGFLSEQ